MTERSLVGEVRDHSRAGVRSAAVVASASALAELIVPVTVAFALGQLVDGVDIASALWLPVAGVVLSAALAGARVRMLAAVAARQMRVLRLELADRLLRLSPRRAEEIGTDEGVNLLSRYGNELEALLSADRIRRWVAAATAMGCVALMFAFEWRLATALLVVLVACAALVSMVLRPVKARSSEGLAALAHVSAEVGEFLRSVRSATVFGLRPTYLRRLAGDLTAVERTERLIGNAQATVDFIVKTSLTLALLGLGAFGTALVAGGETSPMQLAGLLASLAVLMAPAAQYADMLQQRTRAAAAEEWLQQLEDVPGDQASVAPVAPALDLDVEVSGALFAPAEGISVGPVTFQVGRGDFVCLAGPSGAGKTSALSALAGFVPVVAGEVTLNGRPVHEWAAPKLWRNLAYVEQGTPIVGATVREFLATGSGTVDEQQALDVLARLGLMNRLTGGGLDTPLERMGTSMSGGERQRLSLARALCSDRPLLLLDEPTSNLDAEGEQQVLDLLDEVRGTRAVLIASHSEPVISRADAVVRLGAAQPATA